MAGREPAWFKPEPFCRQVFHFAFRQLGAILPETAEDLNRFPEEFREAVIIVGRGVFTLQLIIRNKLRPLFIESMNLLADIQHGDVYKEMFSFMTEGYLHGDIFKSVLTCFAIVAELILFLYEFGLPIPAYWFPMPWCAIYEYRLRDELEYNGGWERLLDVTKRRYTDSEFYEETFLSYLNDSRIAFAEVQGINNLPANPLEFFYERFGVAPRSTTLAMRILEEIYDDGTPLTPEPGAGADIIRMMLGLPPLPPPPPPDDDDWV